MNQKAIGCGDTVELDYKGRTVRALMIDGVPWFCLRDIVEALGWAKDTIDHANDPAFPPWAAVTAGEGYDPDEIETSPDLVLLSPVGVHFWASFVDEWKGQGIAAWAKRESRRLCPKPVSGDRAMFLTIVDRADGTKALPPYGHRFSGWKSDWEDLKWSNEWIAAEDHNRTVVQARRAVQAERDREAGKTISDIVADWRRQHHRPIGLSREVQAATV